MATRRAQTRIEQGTATGDTHRNEAFQSPFPESDERLARELRPVLYCQITKDHVSFDHIAKAWWIRNDPDNPVGEEEKRVSRFLEYWARERFSEGHEGIVKDYWSDKPWAGCALTGDGWVHSVMNSNDPELVLYEDRIHQLCRDAHRTFEAAVHRNKKEAKEDLTEVGDILCSILTRVISTASVLEDEHASQHERDEALAAVRIEWKIARASVNEIIQRQARFEYFEGVGLGAVIAISAMGVAGWAAVRYGANELNEPGEPGSFTAAIIGGAIGAVISVTQRMTANTLMIDFTAPKYQRVLLGMLRPLIGAVFGAVVYFAIIGGLLAVQAKTGNEDASVALAFFAMAGFAAGFSERFATDVLNRASSNILPTTRDKLTDEKPDELSLLLSEQPRHAKAPATQDHQAAAPQGTPGEKDEARSRKRPRRRRHHFFQRFAA